MLGFVLIVSILITNGPAKSDELLAPTNLNGNIIISD